MRKRFIYIFLIGYAVFLLLDWGARCIPFHFGFHAAHFFMVEQVGKKTRYYRADETYDQPIHGYLSHLIGVEEFKNYHHQTMHTDNIGLRVSSNADKKEKWPIAIAGDSFVFGSYNTDDDTLSSKLEKKLNAPVKNLSFPGDPVKNMIDILRRDDDMPPIVIWGITERAIKESAFDVVDDLTYDGVLDWEKASPDTCGFDRFKEWFEVFAKDSYIRNMVNRTWSYIKFYILNQTPEEIWAPINPHMLFYKEGVNLMGRKPDARLLDLTANATRKVVDAAASRGTDVIVLLIPDKCSVYPEYVHSKEKWDNLKQNRFLDQIESELEARDIDVVNLWPIFETEKSNGLLYYADDTHWNSRGIDVASETLAAHIK